MDIFQQIYQFWLAILNILFQILNVLTSTTQMLNDIRFHDSPIEEYLGYVRYVLGSPLYTMFMSVIIISIGVTVYKTFLKGVFLVKELLIKIGR